MSDSQRAPNLEDDEFVSWKEFLSSSHTSSLALVCLAVWLHAADSLIVATMLPSIVADVGGAGLVGWSVSLYEIASVVAGAASALLTMRLGLRKPMAMAAALFGLGCLLSSVATTMPGVLSGRVLQGLGGGGLVAMSFVSIGVLFPKRYTPRTMAAVSTFWGVSAFFGPLIGGVFVEFATWRWGFVFFAAQAFALAVWIALRSDHTAPGTQQTGAFPWKRLSLLCLAVFLISYGGVNVALVDTTVCVVLGLALLAAFLRLDGQAGDNRLMPKNPFTLSNTTGSAFVMIFSLCVATIAITAFGPLLITAIHNTSALTAGYVIACSSIGWTIAAISVSGLPERLDRLMIGIGVAVIVASVIGFIYAVPNGPVWLIAVFATAEGAGFGAAWTFVLRRTLSLADPTEVQRISGAIPTVQRLGYALGAAYIGIVANAVGFADMNGTQDATLVAKWVFLACIPFAAMGLLGMFRLNRNPQGAIN
jgi:MFS family permease